MRLVNLGNVNENSILHAVAIPRIGLMVCRNQQLVTLPAHLMGVVQDFGEAHGTSYCIRPSTEELN